VRVSPLILVLLLLTTPVAAAPLHTWGTESEPPEETEASALALQAARVSEPVQATVAPQSVVLESVDIVGNTTTLDSVVRSRVPFRPGSVLDLADDRIERLRWDLLATGYFSDVTLSLRRGSARGAIRLIVTVTERITLSINDVWLGISARARRDGSKEPLSAFGGLDVTEHNFGGTGISLGGALAVAQEQVGVRARVGHPNFLGSKLSVDALALYNRTVDALAYPAVSFVQEASERPAAAAVVPYSRFGANIGVGYPMLDNRLKVFLDYRLESIEAQVPNFVLRAGSARTPARLFLEPETSLVSSLRTVLVLDTRASGAPMAPGMLLSAFAEVAPSILGSAYPFFKVTSRVVAWKRLPWGHTLSPEVFVGAVWGDSPLFDRFFVADFSDFLPDRILELNVDRRPAPNLFGTIQGAIPVGNYGARTSLEYLVPLYQGRASILQVSAFARVGLYSVFSAADLGRGGYAGARAIPLDLTANFGLRVATSLGPATLGFSSLLFFLPARAGAP
jgi:outer membrane protein insertion porin family